MIKHIVLFKTLPNADRGKVEGMMVDFRKLGSTTSYIKNLTMGEDISHRGSFDLALCCEFESEDDLKRYAANEEHQRLIHDVMPQLLEPKREVVDYIY